MAPLHTRSAGEPLPSRIGSHDEEDDVRSARRDVGGGVDPARHRRDVVRRLLELGIGARTLIALLPDWAELIRAVKAELADPVSETNRPATAG